MVYLRVVVSKPFLWCCLPLPPYGGAVVGFFFWPPEKPQPFGEPPFWTPLLPSKTPLPFGNPPPPFRKLFGTSPPPLSHPPLPFRNPHPFRRTPTPFFLLERSKPKLGHESQHVGTPLTSTNQRTMHPPHPVRTKRKSFSTSAANSRALARKKLLVSSDHLPPTSTTRTTRPALWCGPTNSGYVLAFFRRPPQE